MLRRSISQIFVSPTPQQEHLERLQAEEVEKKIALMQNSRPMYPLPGQQAPAARYPSTHTAPSTRPFDMPAPLFGSLPPAVEIAVRQRQPQIAAIASPQQREVVLDAAIRHPVFFTERLKKPPNGVVAGGAINPVAEGYIFNDGGRGWGGGEVKL